MTINVVEVVYTSTRPSPVVGLPLGEILFLWYAPNLKRQSQLSSPQQGSLRKNASCTSAQKAGCQGSGPNLAPPPRSDQLTGLVPETFRRFLAEELLHLSRLEDPGCPSSGLFGSFVPGLWPGRFRKEAAKYVPKSSSPGPLASSDRLASTTSLLGLRSTCHAL